MQEFTCRVAKSLEKAKELMKLGFISSPTWVARGYFESQSSKVRLKRFIRFPDGVVEHKLES